MHIKYFFEIFGHEGQNSILSYLKSEGWATFLQVSKKSIIRQITKFELNIELTAKGMKNYAKVVEAVFAQAQNLKKKGPQDKCFKEINEMGNLQFSYQDRSKPMDQCVKVAMQAIKVGDDIAGLVLKECLSELKRK